MRFWRIPGAVCERHDAVLAQMEGVAHGTAHAGGHP